VDTAILPRQPTLAKGRIASEALRFGQSIIPSERNPYMGAEHPRSGDMREGECAGITDILNVRVYRKPG
jgi:hypothetical protein